VHTGLPQRAEYTGQTIPGQIPIAPEIDAVAPPFTLTTLSANSLSLYSLRGKPIIINFWATWCEPCRVEMPSLQAVYETYEQRGLRVLAVNLGEPQETVQEWVQQMRLTFDILLDTDLNTAALYYLRGQPSTYVLSPNGIITHVFYGPFDESALRGLLAPYFMS
jgi:peroxiredoxin